MKLNFDFSQLIIFNFFKKGFKIQICARNVKLFSYILQFFPQDCATDFSIIFQVNLFTLFLVKFPMFCLVFGTAVMRFSASCASQFRMLTTKSAQILFLQWHWWGRQGEFSWWFLSVFWFRWEMFLLCSCGRFVLNTIVGSLSTGPWLRYQTQSAMILEALLHFINFWSFIFNCLV